MLLRFSVRRSIVLALAILGCGRDAPTPGSGTATASREPDPIVIRVPRSGGIARAAVYPALDSIIWEAGSYPALDRVLGFDAEAGMFAVITRGGRPAHLDLRLGRSLVASRDTLRSPNSANGSDIFGIDARGRVIRLSPVGSWIFSPPSPAKAVYAQPGGAILVLSSGSERATLWRLYPPDDQILDSVGIPPVRSAVGTPTGDRLYIVTDTAIVPVQTRTLEPARSVRSREPVLAALATPSGDRVYLARRGTSRLLMIERFADGRSTEIQLPGEPTDLRMDPVGRYLLARPANGDSVWVVAVATSRLVNTLPSRWMSDLPAVAPDGAIATLGQRDVAFINPETGNETMRATGGATEFWIFFNWNGFRPRAAGLDVPVAFPTTEPEPDTLQAIESPSDQTRPPAPPGGVPPAQPPIEGFTVSFATLLSQQRAVALADSIVIGAARARVVPGEAAGVPIYRVVIGPYPRREDAEAAGRVSGRLYWIFEGHP
jgi:hypothetical protein